MKKRFSKSVCNTVASMPEACAKGFLHKELLPASLFAFHLPNIHLPHLLCPLHLLYHLLHHLLWIFIYTIIIINITYTIYITYTIFFHQPHLHDIHHLQRIHDLHHHLYHCILYITYIFKPI